MMGAGCNTYPRVGW